MKMPYGRFQGRELDEIPIRYLEYVLREHHNIYGNLKKEVTQILAGYHNCSPDEVKAKLIKEEMLEMEARCKAQARRNTRALIED